MKVPKGKTVGIGNRVYAAGEELPADYSFPEKKKANKKNQDEKDSGKSRAGLIGCVSIFRL